MIPNNFTSTEIDELKGALTHLSQNGPYPLPIKSALLQKIFEKGEWVNGSSVLEDLKNITEAKSLEEIQTKLAVWAREIESQTQEKTVAETEELEKEAERQEAARQEAREKGQKDVERFVKQQTKIVETQKEKIIYLEPKEGQAKVSLSQNEELVLGKMVQAVDKSESQFVTNFSNLIIEKSGADNETAKFIALDVAAKLKGRTGGTPVGVYTAIAAQTKSQELKEVSLGFALKLEEGVNCAKGYLYKTIGQNISDAIYGNNQTEYVAKETQTENTTHVANLDNLNLKGEFANNPIAGLVQGKVENWAKGWVTQRVANLPKDSFLGKIASSNFFKEGVAILTGVPTAEYVGTSVVGKAITLFFPEFAPLIAKGAAKIGIDIGLKIAAPAVAEAAGGVAIETVGKASLGKLAAAALLKIGVSVPASFVPGLNIALWGYTILSTIKAFWPKIKQFLADNPWVGPLILVGGLITSLAPAIVIGGVLTAATIPFLLANGIPAAAIGIGIGRAFARIGKFFAVTIGAPIIIALVVFPIAVALILFIINSGAYLVPPKTSVVPFGDNPYIDIVKTASPSCRNRTGDGCVSGFPDVTYTVKVVAKKGVLTNISFSNSYTVVGNNAPVPNPSIPEITTPPESISPAVPFTFTYTLPLGSEYNDTVVTDAITITADTPGASGISAATSASVITGDPPVDCPLLGGKILWFSYLPGDETSRRHGNNRYWGSASCTSWALPQSTGCYGPNDPKASSNKCYNNPAGSCSYYGYAIDVFYGTIVVAPRIGKDSVTWSCNYGFSNGDGGSSGHTYICSSGQYKLVLTHMKNGAKTGTINSGDQIGELYPQGGNTHLHVEFAINGQYVKPEEYFCSQ